MVTRLCWNIVDGKISNTRTGSMSGEALLWHHSLSSAVILFHLWIKRMHEGKKGLLAWHGSRAEPLIGGSTSTFYKGPFSRSYSPAFCFLLLHSSLPYQGLYQLTAFKFCYRASLLEIVLGGRDQTFWKLPPCIPVWHRFSSCLMRISFQDLVFRPHRTNPLKVVSWNVILLEVSREKSSRLTDILF